MNVFLFSSIVVETEGPEVLPHHTPKYAPGVAGSLAVHAHKEVCLLVGFEGLRDDAVVAGRQFVALTYLPHVGEHGTADCRVVLEELQVQGSAIGLRQLQQKTDHPSVKPTGVCSSTAKWMIEKELNLQKSGILKKKESPAGLFSIWPVNVSGCAFTLICSVEVCTL